MRRERRLGLPGARGAAASVLAGLLALGSATLPAEAQRPKVETVTVEEGLPSSTVYDLAQDAMGRLWIVSRGGLSVYDSHTLTTFSSASGLPEGELAAVEVHGGGVWTVTRSYPRVYFLRGGRWQALPELPELGADDRATTLAVLGGAGRVGEYVAVGTRARGLWVWNGEEWSLFDARQGLPSPRINCLTAFHAGIAVGTEAGLCLLEGLKLDCRLRDADPRLAGRIFALSPGAPAGEAERFWVLGEGWLGYLEGGRLHLVAEGFELAGFDLTMGAVVADPLGGVYFGSPRRAYFLDPIERRVRPLGLPEGLVGGGVTSLLSDRESNVWIGGLRGLSKVSSQRFLSFDRRQGLLENEVTAVLEPEPGRFILGHNNGLTFLDGERVETAAFERSSRGGSDANRVLDMAIDDRGGVWAAAQNMGLLRLAADRSWTRELDAGVFSVELDAGGSLWACTYEELFVLDGSRFVRVDHGFDRKPLRLRWLTAAADGRLYVASRSGLLWREDGGTWRSARAERDDADDVYSVHPGAAGEVWVGTRAGLYRLAGGKLEAVREPAVDRPVYFLLEDDRGRVWIGTDDGVFVWDGDDLRHLSVRHGLAGRETNRGAALVDHRGQVWIGTDQGLSVYREPYDRGQAVAPALDFSAVEAAGRRWPADADLRLAYDENTLVFHVRTISFSDEQDALRRYELEGFDTVWQEPAAFSGSEIRYTNVPPGRYRFRVAAGWPGGPWSLAATSGEIFIARPLWRRPWFLALAAAAGVLLVLGVHAVRTRAIRARNQALEALTSRLHGTIGELEAAQTEREELITELESKNQELERFTYTVSHDLKSPLITIKGFLGLLEKDAAAGDAERVRRDVERIAGATDRMGQLLGELLELSRIGRMVNVPEEVPFAELAAEAVEVVAGQIAARGARVEIAPDLPAVTGDKIRLLEVTQNLVENAVKFMGEEASPRIEIGARRDAGEPGPVFYVADNGIGIEPRYHAKVFGLFERLDQRVEGTGVGLALVKRIVEVHGGRIWVESEGEGRGSTFCFTLPGEVEDV